MGATRRRAGAEYPRHDALGSRLHSCLILSVVLGAIGCGSLVRGPTGEDRGLENRLSSVWNRYRSLPEHKAMAMAMRNDPHFRVAFGIAWGMDDVEGAQRSALDQCELSRAEGVIESPCRTVALDGRSGGPSD